MQFPRAARRASASGELRLGRACRRGRPLPSGALETARLAALAAAGGADDMALVCPVVRLWAVRVGFSRLARGVKVRVDVAAEAKGGLEMAALTAVSAACLTLFDLQRSRDPGLAIGPLRLEPPARPLLRHGR